MVGVTDGEYLPLTPSFTASLPFAPEYLGWSNLPPSIAKWRWPSPWTGGLPTACGASLKPLTLTFTLTVPGLVPPSFGLTNLTFAPGAPTCLAAVVGAGAALLELFLLLLPQPATATATSGIATATLINRFIDEAPP